MPCSLTRTAVALAILGCAGVAVEVRGAWPAAASPDRATQQASVSASGDYCLDVAPRLRYSAPQRCPSLHALTRSAATADAATAAVSAVPASSARGQRTANDCTGAFYSNGDPDYNNGLAICRGGSFYDAWLVDDFTVYGDVTIQYVHWMITMTAEFGFTGTADLYILADDGGVPGTPVYELFDLPATAVPTGYQPWSTPEWVCSIEGLSLPLTPGLYWLGVRPVGSGRQANAYWLTTRDIGAGSWYIIPEFQTTWTPSLWEYTEDYSMVFCVGGITPTGACCDMRSGTCVDAAAYADCRPPLRFTPNTNCAAAPPCGTMGACCAGNLTCISNGYQSDCEADGGRFYPGMACPDFACPDVCDHRIDLLDSGANGWNGDRLDLYVDGVLLLNNIYLPEGRGPLSFSFPAGNTSVIHTVFHSLGYYSNEPYYRLFDGSGMQIIQDGGSGQAPAGVTVAGRCPEATGACCRDGACIGTLSATACHVAQGRFFEGADCASFTCPEECPLRIEMYDFSGDGWNGNWMDILRNGVPVLSGITMDSGYGPLTYTFTATEHDVIRTVYHADGVWARETSYKIYSGAGQLLAADGENYQIPQGVTLEAYCTWHTDGACCGVAGQCQIVPQADCTSGTWLGAGTQCFLCPCVLPADPAARPEPEPCGEDADGGCATTPPTAEFAPISCGDTIRGSLWFSGWTRDTDWYELTTDEFRRFTWTDESEIPVQLYVLDASGPGECTDSNILYRASGEDCAPVSIQTDSLPPGTYRFWVAPLQILDQPCAKYYNAHLACEPGETVHCVAAGACQEFIAQVDLGTIHTQSDCGGYSDNTDLSTDVTYGEAQTLSVSNGDPLSTDVCAVWVDWNHDFAFDHAKELIGVATGIGPYSFKINPPTWALPGPTRLRIRLVWNDTSPSPCGVLQDGEVEDYTLNLIAVPGVCCRLDGTCAVELPQDCDGVYGGPLSACSGVDCDSNGVDDACDLLTGDATDCDANGVPDRCQPWHDCNLNGQLDSCDIALGLSTDCNRNDVPDECDLDPTDPDGDGHVSADCQPNGIPDECDVAQVGGGLIYQWDDGSRENGIGLSGGGYVLALNHFAVRNGQNRIGAVHLAYGRAPAGLPLTVYVWSDPDGDGQPNDAQVLASANTTVVAPDTNTFSRVPLPTAVEIANGSFFVGAIYFHHAGERPTALDQHSFAAESWIAGYAATYDPNNLPNATSVLQPLTALSFQGNWMIRAEVDVPRDCNNDGVPDECALPPLCQGPDCDRDCNADGILDSCQLLGRDCNGNGRLDECDLAGGTSTDRDGDGVPDECEIAVAWGGLCDGPACDHDCQLDGVPDSYQLWADVPHQSWAWDDGSSELAVGLSVVGELCWLQYVPDAGPVTVHEVLVTFGTPTQPGESGAVPGTPFRVYVWSDPDRDGTPLDGVLLAQATATVDPNAVETDQFQTVPIRATLNGGFFVGVSMWHPVGKYPAPVDTSQSVGAAWFTYDAVPFDPHVWNATNTYRLDSFYAGNWLLRVGLTWGAPPDDCDQNGWPDECDIAASWGGLGTGPQPDSDWNHNGTPDGCEPAGDLDGDGDVDLDDVARLLASLAGPDNANPGVPAEWFDAADLTHDGDVDLADFSRLQRWFGVP